MSNEQLRRRPFRAAELGPSESVSPRGRSGTALLSIGAVVDREQLFFSYLIAYAYAVSIAVGALIFLMVCHAMRAGWPVAIRRLTEAVVAVFPVLAVLFIPLAFGLGTLYPWLHPDRFSNPEERDLVLHKLRLPERARLFRADRGVLRHLGGDQRAAPPMVLHEGRRCARRRSRTGCTA